MNLLQIVTNSAGADTTATAGEAAADSSVSLLELLMKGGPTMIIILLLSIVAVYIFVERFLTLRKAAQKPEAFMSDIRNRVMTGDVNGAKLLCSQMNTPFARMIEKGISRIGNSMKNIEVSIENVGKIELYKLEKNLNSLATISGAAPMIGFFGTVIGMIKAFMAIAQQEGNVSPKLLSSGIYEAMITTAAGLFVGILAYIAYNYLVSKVETIVHNMEHSSIEFIDILQEPQS